MATRYYSPEVRAALAAFSASKCYWPGCGEQLLKFENDKYWVALDIAHICALHPGGPRYDPTIDKDDLNDFPNLIYLCRLHHRIVDEGDGSAYPVELLRDWKINRETTGQQQLRAESPVTIQVFEEAIAEAMQLRDEQIEEIVARLEQTDQEAARLMRELREELADARHNGSIIDPDAAAMLSHAAHQLQDLSDSSARLGEVAHELSNLNDLASRLENAADRLGNYR